MNHIRDIEVPVAFSEEELLACGAVLESFLERPAIPMEDPALVSHVRSMRHKVTMLLDLIQHDRETHRE